MKYYLRYFSFKNYSFNSQEKLMSTSKNQINQKDPPISFKVKKCISQNSYVNLPNYYIKVFIDNTFCLFKSKDNKSLLIFSHTLDYKNYSLIIYDLFYQQIITKKFNAHKDRIYTCRHYFYEKINSDLLITSSFDKFIKIWNITNKFSLIFEKKPDYNYKINTYLLSENLLFYQKLYLITSAYELNSEGYNILFYDISKKNHPEKEIGQLMNSKDNTNFLDVYYEKDIPYIVSRNYGNIKIFDFPKKVLIKEFHDNYKKINYFSIIIKENEILKKKNLIASGADGILRIWDYTNPKKLLYKLTESKIPIIGLCLLNNQYILTTTIDGKLLEYDLYTNKLVSILYRDKDKNINLYNHVPLFNIKKIEINKKQYLVTHSYKGLIELWEKDE